MCGRYHLSRSKAELIERFSIFRDELSGWEPRYNIAPTSTVPIVRLENGERTLSGAHWGLVPFWAKEARTGFSMINARAETIAEKRSFKGPLQKTRCLVPADGWYEWRAEGGVKQPYHFSLPGGTAAFAGLWTWHPGLELLSCSIIVTSANETAAAFHDRMPVILPDRTWADFLAPETSLLAIHELLRPYPEEDLVAMRVSRYVSKTGNEGTACIEPDPIA